MQLLGILVPITCALARIGSPDDGGGDPFSVRCSDASTTPGEIQLSWRAQPQTDLYSIGIYQQMNGCAERLKAVDTVAALASGATVVNHTLQGLHPGAGYMLRLRSHSSAAPTASRGWRNASVSTFCRAATQCAPDVATWYKPQSSIPAAKSRFLRVYRVSEETDDIDYLTNHNSADADGIVAFLSDGAADGTPAFAAQPVTEYCIEHVDRIFADYVSCNGPEASPRNNMSDPICICDVYADRMISLQTKAEMLVSCGPVSVAKGDGMLSATCLGHTGSPARCCNCSKAGSATSMWTEPAGSDRFIGQQPVFLPYFYYQAPKPTYPGTRRFGSWYSTPKMGECKGGSTLGTNGCTWRLLPRARVVWGAELLARGWNATYVRHWPLHEFGYNTTDQCLHNAPIFRESYAAMDGWVDAESACAMATQ